MPRRNDKQHRRPTVAEPRREAARGRLENPLSDLIFLPKTNAANERLA
jgi:hypothetical protein